ncbi:MAG: adenylate kinase family protein [Archaeoglobaceae archaeon]
MIVALTGTPGVGKSRVADILSDKGYSVKSVSELAERYNTIIGEEMGARIIDTDTLSSKIDRSGFYILEGHLSHHLDPDMVVVLRCNPKILKKRLGSKGWSEEKVLENLEAEITDTILMEALSHKNVYEIDASHKNAEEVAEIIIKIINEGSEDFEPGNIDWILEIGDDLGGLIRKHF